MDESVRPVSCPFQTYLGAGKSKFVVSIPRPFLTGNLPGNLQPVKRKFYFSHLRIVPDFYNRDAYLFNFDTLEDLSVRLDYNFGIWYYMSYDLFPGPLEYPRETLPNLANFFATLNRWSVSIKPTSMIKPPFFIDWVDSESRTEALMERNVPDWAQLAKDFTEMHAEDYYGEDFDADRHSNKLPSHFRSIPFSNNFLFPTQASRDPNLLDRLRIRIALAPNTKVSFSSKKMLQSLGFDAQRRAGTALGFVNRDPDKYQYFVAEEAPFVDTPLVAARITVTPAAESFFVTRAISFTPKEKRSNEELGATFKTMLEKIAKETNVDLNVSYGKTTGIFTFQWPTNSKINVELSGDPELYQRLGFGLVNEVNKNSVSTVFKIGDKESASKSKVLCFDTGQVVVTCQNTSSNLTSVSNNEYLLSLLPMGIGVMEMPPLTHDYLSIVPPAFEGGQQDTVPFHCRLWKFDDMGKMVPFSWNIGAVISGVLKGKV